MPLEMLIKHHQTHLGGFHSHGGTPNSWMVFLIEHPIKMDDLGVALF